MKCNGPRIDLIISSMKALPGPEQMAALLAITTELTQILRQDNSGAIALWLDNELEQAQTPIGGLSGGAKKISKSESEENWSWDHFDQANI